MFTDALWEEWSSKEEANYRLVNGKRKFLKKSYLHLDNRFWFPEKKEELKKILQDRLLLQDSNGKKRYWSFSPFLRVLVKTPRFRYDEEFKTFNLESKIRPICFASHLDSLIFGFYAYGLTKVYEGYIDKAGFSDSVLAYRSNLGGKSNIQFAKEAFEIIRLKGECTAIALDIKGYFDHIDHGILKKNWAQILNAPIPDDQYKIFKTLTKYSYVNQLNILKRYNIDLAKLKRLGKMPATLLEIVPGDQDYQKYTRLRTDGLIVTNEHPNKETGRHNGIPQGSSLSALMSNVYLIEFDRELFHRSQAEGFVYRRYCDDILIICETSKANEIKDYVIKKICDEFYLTIQQRKVDITDFYLNSKGRLAAFNRKKLENLNRSGLSLKDEKRVSKPLQYLGFEFDGTNIRIRTSSLSRYFRKMKARLDKTVAMSYSAKAKSDKIFKKQIFERYSHLGKRNFLSYAYMASNKEFTNVAGMIKEGMNSSAIRKQISRHFAILMTSLKAKNHRRYSYKLLKGKADNLMKV
ncbi:reverse transcriptase/maturase family protein [Flavisolibacter ginsenosidimutans]|uniref:Reverse transcriptase domain-containing protein n=1 Tax=Flavisolibacter ginsenosidimutans TaxID=661481 RepID=A0A5B8UHY8_9BACT|nr:reverse transcriptase/maturase family protein [Flavisolibacter ginsenosidimutans]QEC55700.1 hypothetical protein FSB75_07270 [Flavisolibacter ginsenosidimutans]